MKKNYLLNLGFLAFAAALFASVTPFLSKAQKLNQAINFPGTTSFEHINLGDSLSNKLDTVSFTVEMWINFTNNTNGDPAFIGNKDWNSGANTGFAWALNNSTTLRFNFRPAGGTRRDYNTTVAKLTSWNHIAMVVDRKGYLTAYINGIQTGTPILIAADSARSVDGVYPVQLGSDGTGTYNYNGVSRFNGKIDEVRFWLGARTQTQLRDNMCHKLSGSETNLLAYYTMNDTNSVSIPNHANAYSTLFIGAFQNSPTRIVSAAPVGDTSANIYSASLASQSLTLTNSAKGNLTASILGGSLKGFHIYSVDSTASVAGISNPGTNHFVYGVFTIDTAAASTPAKYNITYDYSNYTTALLYSVSIDLYQRYSADSIWFSTGATNNATTHKLSLSNDSDRKEFTIGNFATPGVCNKPTNFSVSGVTVYSATLSWTSGGSNRWNIEYGVGAFSLGSGTRLTNVSSSSVTLTGLNQNATYTAYVQDTCLSLGGASAWTGPVTFKTLQNFSPFGSGYAINFPGTAANEHINLDTSMSTALATTDFTVEMWINFSKLNNDESFIGNKNWNSGANIGFVWARSNKSGLPPSSLWFNFTPTGGTRRDWHVTIPGLNLIKNWNHVAASIDRHGDVAFYINGIKANILQYYVSNSLQSSVSTNIADDSGKSIRGTLPTRLGQDGTGTYGVKFNGQQDEVRIWKTVRTQQQIRDYMCRKLPVSASGLLAYYRMDEATGITVVNLATATSGTLNGVLTNNPGRVPSGAAIGDTSVYAYNTNLSGTALSLASIQNGKIIVDSMKPSYSGVQLYRLDTIPNTTFDIADPGSNRVYYGVFPIDTANSASGNFTVLPSSYRLQYDYTNYPAAVAVASNLHLYNRSSGDLLLWTDIGAQNNTASKTLTAADLRNRREVFLADFTAQSCTNVSGISIDSIKSSFASIRWISTGNRWNIQYGPHGFTLGAGTMDTVLGVPVYKATNLAGETSYDFYVRNRCSGDSSKWVGPFNFSTPDQCPVPTVLQSTYLGGDSVRISWNNTGAAVYNLQWGQQGFTLGTGIPIDNITGTSYVLSGLSNTLVYDIYIRDTCVGGGKSKWFGPLSFGANGPLPEAVVTTTGYGMPFRVFPNPASNMLRIDRAGSGASTVSISLNDVQGRTISRKANITLPYNLDLSATPAGFYYLNCSDAISQYTMKLSIVK